MATESLLPNGDDSGWASGSFADVDELVSSPDDGNFIQTAVNGKGEIMIFDLSASGIEDADTVTRVEVNIRGRFASGGPGTLNLALLIGGAAQGGDVLSNALTSSFADTTLMNQSQWNGDWTAAQMDGAQIRVTSGQSGMPVDTQYEVSALDVVVTFTEGGQVFNAVGIASLALRSTPVAAKTAAQITAAKVALRSSDATAKTSAGTASASIATRPAGIAGKVYAGVAVARVGLRTLADFSTTVVIEGVALVRIALGSSSTASKTASAAGRASLAQRTSAATGKVASAIARASVALRTLIAASVPGAIDGIVRVRLALLSATAAAKTSTAAARARLALRATDGTATTRTAQIIGRLAISTSNDGQKTMVGVAFNRFALRAIAATSTEAIGSTVRKVPLDGLFDFNVPLDGHGNPVP